ncbi:hypothetical protein [Mycobacterium sp.]|uniref:hypothetical protein n=1 Tax=Mycobacterium sp. TaxID=1785 RepID=UPI003F976870
MTSTFSPKAAVAARVAGFLALLAAGAALLVLFAAAAHAALGTSSPNAKHAVVLHRAPGAAPHLRHQHSGLRRDGGRHGRPDHQLRARRAADCRSGQQRPAHSNSRTELASLRFNHKTAGAAPAVRHLVRQHAECRRAGTGSALRVQGARYTHVRSNPELVWQL